MSPYSLNVRGYRLVCRIGEGGMSRVYLAEREDAPGTYVALKLIGELGEVRPKVVRRFLREGRVGAGLRHPNILGVLECEERDGQWLIAMEHVEGLPFSQHIRRPGEPGWREALQKNLATLVQVADALAYAHANGVVHRDVKPGNILVRSDGHPLLIDFGIARHISGDTMLTSTGVSMGTPAYMSPEQLQGRAEIGPATDVYSLGVTLYETASGERPFHAESWPVLAEHIRRDEPPRLSRLVPRCPPGLEAVVLRALEKDPAKRYRDMASMRDDLARVTRGLAPETSLWPLIARRGARRVGRHRTRIAAAALALAVALGGFAWTSWQRTSSDLEASEFDGFVKGLTLDLRRGALPRVIEAIDGRIAREPGSADLHRLKAWAFSQFGVWAEEELDLAVALGFDPHSPRPDSYWDHFYLGIYLLAKRDLEGARSSLRRALEIESRFFDAWYPLYEACLAMGLREEALRALRQYRMDSAITEDHPRYPGVRAQILELEGDYAGAIELLESMRGDMPSQVEHLLDQRLGRIHLQLGQYEDAERCFRAVLEQRPGEAWSWANLATSFQRRGDAHRAREHAWRALELDQRISAPYQLLALQAIEEDRVPALVRELERRLPPGPRSREYQRLLAEADYQRGDLDSCLERNPDHAGALLEAGIELGLDSQEAGDRDGLEAACRALERARDLLRDVRAAVLEEGETSVWLYRYRRPSNLLMADVYLVGFACSLGDEGLARDSLEEIDELSASGVELDAGNALNLAEALSTCELAAVRDRDRARRLMAEHRLQEVFGGDPGAAATLERIAGSTAAAAEDHAEAGGH